MFIFMLGAVLGIGCVAVYNEMYSRWMYRDLLKRSKKLGISEDDMKVLFMSAVCERVERNFDGQNN